MAKTDKSNNPKRIKTKSTETTKALVQQGQVNHAPVRFESTLFRAKSISPSKKTKNMTSLQKPFFKYHTHALSNSPSNQTQK